MLSTQLLPFQIIIIIINQLSVSELILAPLGVNILHTLIKQKRDDYYVELGGVD